MNLLLNSSNSELVTGQTCLIINFNFQAKLKWLQKEVIDLLTEERKLRRKVKSDKVHCRSYSYDTA